MKEAQLQRKIQQQLTQHFGAKVVKFHGNEYTEIGTPDLIGVFTAANGRAYPFFLEVKMPGETPSAIQIQRIKEWRDVGAIAGWCTSTLEAIEIIEDHLRWERGDV